MNQQYLYWLENAHDPEVKQELESIRKKLIAIKDVTGSRRGQN
jgi:hypothetical protein